MGSFPMHGFFCDSGEVCDNLDCPFDQKKTKAIRLAKLQILSLARNSADT